MPRGWPEIRWRFSRSRRGMAAMAPGGGGIFMAFIFDKGMVLPQGKIALASAPFSK